MIKTKRAKEAADLEDLDEAGRTAAAFWRIGMRGTGKPAPGEPLGGLAGAKPIYQAKAKKFDPKKRGLDQLPIKQINDFENFVDGKMNRTRLVGTWARFATGSAGRTKYQLHRWCVCNQSKANKESATYPSHFVSTQGSSNNSSAHPNQGKDGCSFVNFTPDSAQAGPGSAKGKGKHAASAATSRYSSTVADADLKRALSQIEHLQNQLRQLVASRDANHLKYAKATELANTQRSLQAKATNELISAHARTLRTSQLGAFNAIAKVREIRGHAEGFVENMLAKATQGEPPDMDAAWPAFSGLLSPELLEHAQWGDVKKKKLPGSRSKDVFNSTAFQVAESAAPPTPDSGPAHGAPAHRCQGHCAADDGRLRAPR